MGQNTQQMQQPMQTAPMQMQQSQVVPLFDWDLTIKQPARVPLLSDMATPAVSPSRQAAQNAAVVPLQPHAKEST